MKKYSLAELRIVAINAECVASYRKVFPYRVVKQFLLLAKDIQALVTYEQGDELEKARRDLTVAISADNQDEIQRLNTIESAIWNEMAEYDMPVIEVEDVDYEELFPDETRSGIWFGFSWNGAGMASFKELDLNGIVEIKQLSITE